MSVASRKLDVGDWAVTDYNTRGSWPVRPAPMTRVQIVAVDRQRQHGHSQSGVMFQVRPPLKNGYAESWYCADWFEPADSGITPNAEVSGCLRAPMPEDAPMTAAGSPFDRPVGPVAGA